METSSAFSNATVPQSDQTMSVYEDEYDEYYQAWPVNTERSTPIESSLGPLLSKVPPEIRKKIWGYSLYQEQGLGIGEPQTEEESDLDWEHAVVSRITETTDADTETTEIEMDDAPPATAPSYPLLNSLLLVNSWIYNEAFPVMLEVNTIVLREQTKKTVSSNTWLLDWLEMREGLYDSVRSIDFQEYSVTEKAYETDEENNPNIKLMELCTNLKHITIHLGHHHYSRPRPVTLEEDLKRWAPVYTQFESACTRWQSEGEHAPKKYAKKESKRMTETYKLDVIGKHFQTTRSENPLKHLKSLEIVPSAMYYRKQKGKMADFFHLVNDELTRSIKELVGPDTTITVAPCRAIVSCNYWTEIINVLH